MTVTSGSKQGLPVITSLRLWLVGGVLAVLAFAGYYVNAALTERDTLRLKVTLLNASLASALDASKVTEAVLSSRVQSSAAIKTKAKNVQVEIEKRLPDSPTACVLPADWRVLHDAAATGDEVPPATSGTDAATVTAKEAASTIADNYEASLDNADRLLKLQQWIEGVSRE